MNASASGPPSAPHRPGLRIGIDLGGTKTELIALDAQDAEIHRKRIPTDARSYDGILSGMVSLVREAEAELGATGTVGIGIPGTLSAQTGRIKNANTRVLDGHALDRDLGQALGRDIRCLNDADCLALSEAADGAGAGHRVVFAAILGTGCGAGIAIDGRPWTGRNRLSGEWGHTPLPWMTPGEFPGPACWCGKSSCIERWISGTGFADDHARVNPDTPPLTAPDIVALARNGDPSARATLDRYIDRLARSLSAIINLLDPDVMVLGGGMSNVSELYERVPPLLPQYVFGREVATPIRPSLHGDSSGVRGAARLWPRP